MTDLQAAKNSLQTHMQHYEKVRQSKIALDHQWENFVNAFLSHFEAEKKRYKDQSNRKNQQQAEIQIKIDEAKAKIRTAV